MGFKSFISFSLIFLLIFLDFSHSAKPFPRWLTEKKTHGSVLRMKTSGLSTTIDPSRVTQLSWKPRAFLYKGFLSDEECDHLINLAKGKLEKSMVADNESGKSIESEVRTSSGMFLSKAQYGNRFILSLPTLLFAIGMVFSWDLTLSLLLFTAFGGRETKFNLGYHVQPSILAERILTLTILVFLCSLFYLGF